MSTWNSTYEGVPDGADAPATLDNVIRDLKESIEGRMANEHDTYVADSTAGAESEDWRHKEGSARVYYQDGTPTSSPGSGGSTLTTNDDGRLWVDSNDDNQLYVWSGSAFAKVENDATTGDFTVGGKLVVTDGVETDGTALKTKVIQIGDWNMDTTHTLSVAHGLTKGDIRSISILIRNDADTATYDFNTLNSLAASNTVQKVSVDATNVIMNRDDAGFFDGSTYDATTYNRGWITITYEA